MKAQSLAGASLKLYINNRPVGIATGFDWTIDYGRTPIFGLDQVTAYELAPGQINVKGRIDCTRIKRDGGLEGRNIVASADNILNEKYINIILIDRDSGSIVFRAELAAIGIQNWRVDPKGILRGSFSFVGFQVTNELDV
jgi:hypothetical protein